MSAPIDLAGGTASLTFAIVNYVGGTATPNVVFIDDSGYNKVSLQVQLSAGSVTLTPGTIPDPSSPPPATGTTIYLDLTTLQMPASAWADIKVTTSGWESMNFPDQNLIGLTPTTPVKLSGGIAGTISLAIAGIEVPAPLASPQVQLYTQFSGVPTVAGGYGAFAVVVQHKPDGGENLIDAISFGLSAHGIVNSPAADLRTPNLFALQLTAQGTVQVAAGDNTVFTVGFVYGATGDQYGYGALTTVAGGGDITATKGLNADDWQVNGSTGNQHPTWSLQPPTGSPIVGAGAQGVVAIDFGNIVSPYQPGPTVMLVSWTGVPGYRDGVSAIVLNKVAHAQITSLTVDPNPSYFSGGEADVTVSWTSPGATQLILTQNFAQTVVTGTTSREATLQAEQTNFTLQATGATGTVPNIAYRTVTAVALPVINSFTGAPTEIFAGQAQTQAGFAWAVDSTDGVTLSSTGGAFSGQSFNASGNTTVMVDEPQMITMAPATVSEHVALSRDLVISAFQPQTATYDAATGGAVAASPTGPFVLLATASGLTPYDTVKFRAYPAVSTGHGGSQVQFSADGATVAVADTDANVTVIAVSLDSHGMPQFGTPRAVSLPGVPHALMFNPDATRLYVTVDGATGQPGQVIELVRKDDGYIVADQQAVGAAPRGMTLDVSGSRLFVANSGDDTVSMIGLTAKGGLGNMTVHTVTGGPTDVAAVSGGRQLLVSCAKANTVVALDPDHFGTGQRTTLNVGKTPGPIALLPSGAYAFVANTGDGSATLIGCGGALSSTAVLGNAIALGSGVSDLSVTPDGLQVLAATGGGLCAVTLATYQTTTTTPSVKIAPTNVVPTADGLSLLTWHDAAIPGSGNTTGILAYTVSTTNTQEILGGKAIVGAACSRDTQRPFAAALVAGETVLYLIDEHFDTSAVTLALANSARTAAVAMAGNAETIWVLTIDTQYQLSLVVLADNTAAGGAVWTQQQTVPLYAVPSTSTRFLLVPTPDGTTILVVDVLGAVVRAVRCSGTTYTLDDTVITGAGHALDATMLPDGSAAYVLNGSNSGVTVTTINVADLTSRIGAVPGASVSLMGLAASPDGRRLFASDSNAAMVRILDPASLRVVQSVSLGDDSAKISGSCGLAVMPDGSSVWVAASQSNTLVEIQQVQMAGQQRQRVRRPKQLPGFDGQPGDDGSSALFMRHALNDSPTTPTTGWSASPDIIPYGLSIQPDLTLFITNAGYAIDYGQNVPLQNPNYVYLRGLNTTPAEITSRAYFYYTRGSLAMWPKNWVGDVGITVNNQPRNWVDITAPPVSATSNGVGVAQVPIIWTPPGLNPGTDHYCVIGWVVNGPNPQPPDFQKYDQFTSFNQLVQFIMNHHNMAWRNTVDIVTPPPNSTYSTTLPILSGGAQLYLFVNFINIPGDATFSLNLQGNTPENTISLSDQLIGDYKGGYTPANNPLSFPPQAFETSLQIALYQQKTPIPDTARIKISVGPPTAPGFAREVERFYQQRGLSSPIRRLGGVPHFIVGSTQYNLRFNGPAVTVPMDELA